MVAPSVLHIPSFLGVAPEGLIQPVLVGGIEFGLDEPVNLHLLLGAGHWAGDLDGGLVAAPPFGGLRVFDADANLGPADGLAHGISPSISWRSAISSTIWFLVSGTRAEISPLGR